MKKYALFPGFVTSQHDGQQHYIGAVTLAHLYRVPMSECIVINNAQISYSRPAGLIPLHPRSDGRYEMQAESVTVQGTGE